MSARSNPPASGRDSSKRLKPSVVPASRRRRIPTETAVSLTNILPVVDDLVAAHGLTPREAQVALEMAGGGRNRDVALRMGVSVHTVRRHVERILLKLRIPTRSSVLPRLLAPLAPRRISPADKATA